MRNDCTVRRQHHNPKMVLLLGSYPPDQQQSMQRFTAMMLRGLTERGIDAEVIMPKPFFGRLLGGFVGKWLGYIDRYLLFPHSLRAAAANADQSKPKFTAQQVASR